MLALRRGVRKYLGWRVVIVIWAVLAAVAAERPSAQVSVGSLHPGLAEAGPETAWPLPPDGKGIFVFAIRAAPLNAANQDIGLNPLLTWRQLEPAEGFYDWRALDNALAQALRTGTKVVPRVYTNGGSSLAATPDWFFASPNARSYYPSARARTSNFKAPVPWDPTYQEKFGNFLRAFGQRYNGHAAIEFVQTNAGGGLFGEIVLSTQNMFPPGWSAVLHQSSIITWVDRWVEAFPNTPLSLMINPVGYNIAENAANYAAHRGVYLQQNSPTISAAAASIFRLHQHRTGIVLEVENGCRTAQGAAFDQMINSVFSHGIAIDYLVICPSSLSDAGTRGKLSSILDRLRPIR